MKTNRVLIGLMGFVLVVVIATSGYMLGYAGGRTAQPAAVTVLPQTNASVSLPAATATPINKASGGAIDTSPTEPADKSMPTFWKVYDLLKANHYDDGVPEGTQLEYDAIQGMIFGLDDQFTSFIPPEQAKLINENATGSFSGIGAGVQLNKGRVLQIMKIYPDSPAEKAGLQVGDMVTEVDGQSIIGEDLDVQVAKVRGPEGSTATFTIVREGEPKPFKVDITRAKIAIKLVESKMLDNNVAYVSLSAFDSATTAQQVQTAVQDLLAKNPKGLIFDLRGNPGGFLDQAKAVADMFLKDGVILYERTKDGQEKIDRSTDVGIAQDLPLVVLVDGGSASASEIVSGAIQDRGRGVLIGTTTFGKGAVQRVYNLDDGSQVRIVNEHWFTPNNHDIHGKGIAPNIVVERGDDPKVDPQLDRAVEYILTGK
ncbi:MAG TPA: S41 family peptidase [Anaerolineae bacterium]|nr:S41 family peptidase [Anaerolineae bacterium]